MAQRPRRVHRHRPVGVPVHQHAADPPGTPRDRGRGRVHHGLGRSGRADRVPGRAAVHAPRPGHLPVRFARQRVQRGPQGRHRRHRHRIPGALRAAVNDAASLQTFQEVRPRLFGIAYRMLGTATEADDVLQDAWVRWQGTDRSAVREPAAFLATTVTRLAMNALDSARSRREVYIGPWLPEPVATEGDPMLGAERAEAMSLAVLLLLERLTPAERAAFVLHEAFDYSFRDIAAVLE